MTKNEKVEEKNENNGSGKAIGVVGALAGAMVGAAAAIALSDKDTRKKVLGILKDHALDTVERMQKESKSLNRVVGEKVEEEKDGIIQKLTDTPKK